MTTSRLVHVLAYVAQYIATCVAPAAAASEPHLRTHFMMITETLPVEHAGMPAQVLERSQSDLNAESGYWHQQLEVDRLSDTFKIKLFFLLLILQAV